MDDKGYELNKSKKVDNPAESNSSVNKIEPSPTNGKPVFGSAKGMFIMMPDFDEPLEDFKEYM
jgi:hypothetical protein